MDMSPRCLAARGMFSGQGGLVYTEMAPKCSCRAGDPCRRWASLPEQPLSDTLPSLGKVGASAALQRLPSSTFGCGTHGNRHLAVVLRGVEPPDEFLLSGEQQPVGRSVPHHHHP